MNDTSSQLFYFYNHHPISRDIILAKLRASRIMSTTCARKTCMRTTRITMVVSTPRTNWRDRRRSVPERPSPTFAPVLAGQYAISLTNTEPTSPASNLRLCALQARKN